jgi:hypothetical protein
MSKQALRKRLNKCCNINKRFSCTFALVADLRSILRSEAKAERELAACKDTLRKIQSLNPIPRYVGMYLDVLRVEKGVKL